MINIILELLLLLLVSLFSIFSKAEAVTVNLDYPFRNIYAPSDLNEAAIKILETETKKFPENYNLHFVLGVLYSQIDFRKAKKEFEKVISLKPEHYISHVVLGYLIEAGNTPEEAIAYLTKISKSAPRESMIYNALTTIYMRQNKMDEAKDILEKGIGIINNDESLYFNQTLILLKFYQGQKEQEKIERNMKKAIELSPKEEYYFILGIFYLQKQKYEDAREAFKHAIELNPQNIYAILGLATTYEKIDQYEKAIEIAKQAIGIDPSKDKEIHEEIREYEDAYKKWKEKR